MIRNAEKSFRILLHAILITVIALLYVQVTQELKL
jgi:hypothetical protein